jgi:hypothetical protein
MGPPVGQALEFLSQVLSQRGPQAVPYAENVKWNIREHLSDLLKVGPRHGSACCSVGMTGASAAAAAAAGRRCPWESHSKSVFLPLIARVMAQWWCIQQLCLGHTVACYCMPPPRECGFALGCIQLPRPIWPPPFRRCSRPSQSLPASFTPTTAGAAPAGCQLELGHT